jgi:penicillin-binding protein 1C
VTRRLAALLLWLFTALAAAQSSGAVPPFEAVRQAHRPSDVLFTSHDGQPFQWQRVDPTVRRGVWLPLHEFSPALRQALVVGEDRRFWHHHGVDWAAVAAAAWDQAWRASADEAGQPAARGRGASTLSMQLAALLDPALARPGGGRSLPDKVRQMHAAQALEARWSKAQVLEAYLNLVPLRGELVGVDAAAQVLLGKQAQGLDSVDSALLVALVRAPQAPASDITRRACALLRAQALGCEGLPTLVQATLNRAPQALSGPQAAPHYARWWLAQQHDTRPTPAAVATTLDAGLQGRAIAALRQQLAELRGRNVEDGAVLVLDNASGAVLAWVGSAGAGAGAREVDAVLARRQPGSALKPLVYGEALARGLITPESLLLDAPVAVAAGRATWAPRNHDLQHRGWVSARQALAGSLNVPAVQVARWLGQDAVFAALQRAGLRLRESAGWHGHALVLGSAEVSLLDLTNAYRALANQGRWAPVQQAPGQAGGRLLFSAAVAAELTAILADTAARAEAFGFDSPLALRQVAAVKTGTSKDMRDNWAVGYNARFTVGVWMGNASGAPMHGISGVQGAAPVWRQVMQALPGTDEAWSRASTAARPLTAGLSLTQRVSSIGPLHDGSVLALDPDIAPERQRVRLHGPSGQWLAGGRALGSGASVWWTPQPGRHRLEVRDDGGSVIDAITVDVRRGSPQPLKPQRP